MSWGIRLPWKRWMWRMKHQLVWPLKGKKYWVHTVVWLSCQGWPVCWIMNKNGLLNDQNLSKNVVHLSSANFPQWACRGWYNGSAARAMADPSGPRCPRFWSRILLWARQSALHFRLGRPIYKFLDQPLVWVIERLEANMLWHRHETKKSIKLDELTSHSAFGFVWLSHEVLTLA